MANKRIIILEKPDPAGAAFNVAFWAIVPVNYQPFYADRQKDFVSAYKAIDGAEASKFTTGEWTERAFVYSRPDGTGIAQAKADLQVEWQKFQTEINGTNPWSRYGTYWDDVGVWTDNVIP